MEIERRHEEQLFIRGQLPFRFNPRGIGRVPGIDVIEYTVKAFRVFR